jgi:GNAT superfamily N-acetyltransferase
MPSTGVAIRRAAAADLDLLTPLFDRYRRFYLKPSDPDGARRFLKERLAHDESVIFLACDGEAGLGFTQLYPSFSSAAMARIFVLNDLFVAEEARERGVGTGLLAAAAEYGRQAGAVRLVLSTELTNATAQRLYEKTGWKRDTIFCAYQLTL